MTSRTATLALFALWSCVDVVQGQSKCPVLEFADEFNGNALDLNIWTPQLGDGCQLGPNLCGWGNNEAQWYREENLEVSDGSLKIVAKRETFGERPKEFTSAKIRSINNVDLDLTKELLIEARIKVPSGGQGVWPAFWLMPTPEVLWPTGGEIDVMEFIGREPFFAQGYMHYGIVFGDKVDKGSPIRLPEPLYDDFHVFSIIKKEERITWLMDGYIYQSFDIEDIQPKYTWPFERTYHLILNLAVGGNWPGYPDETSTFPTEMEVDYVRVYDLAGDKVVPNIVGTRLVHQNEGPFQYCVQPNNEAVSGTTWTVPSDATYQTSERFGCIDVTFGVQSGYVKASIPTSCGPDPTLVLSVPVEVQSFYGKDFALVEPRISNVEGTLQATLTATGSASVMLMDNIPTWEYVRSSELFDNFELTVDVQDIESYTTGERKFFVDVKTTTSAPCARIMIQLEDSTESEDDNYPTGRHSRYQCLLEPTRDWQRIACDFKDRPDVSISSADRIVVLIDPGMVRNDVYYLRNLDVTKEGCTQNCEPLQSNGPSTDNCRKKAKSEAGACNDGINNNDFGYDGNLVSDCDDPECFLLDPVCGGPSLNQTPPPTQSFTTPPPTMGSTSPPPTKPPTRPPTQSPTEYDPSFSSPTQTDATTNPPTAPPTVPSTPPPTLLASPTNPPFAGPAECSLNPACVGLADDCCPTPIGQFLTCCFQEPPSTGSQYEKDFTLVAPASEPNAASYLISSAPYFDPGTAPDGSSPVIAYERSVNEMFDLIYYSTSAIPSATPYLQGDQKFFMEVFSTANECTQIMIQLDSLEIAEPDNFPIGRHSRYVAFTTTSNAWETLEFDLLDRPDPLLPDNSVTGFVVFFDPGVYRSDTFFVRTIDSGTLGCTSNCLAPAIKACPAVFRGEDGACGDGIDNDVDGLLDCEDPDCVLASECQGPFETSFARASSFLRVEGGPEGSSAASLGVLGWQWIVLSATLFTLAR